MVGAGADATEGLCSRMVRGRPNWWVILAVSLALMALLVATTGSDRRTPARGRTLAPAAAASASRASGATSPTGAGGRTAHAEGTSSGARRASTQVVSRTTTTTTTAAPGPAPTRGGAGSGASSLTADPGGGVAAPNAPAPTTTTTSVPATTTSAPSAVPADRTQTQGYLDPPVQTSNHFGFTGTGAMQVSVVWSGSTYLTMSVSCPDGSQSVGGTAAMAATLPDASGSCLATVSEPPSETAALTYTITIGPAGG